MRFAKFTAGDWVIYRKLKHSASPGRRAHHISPSPHGELYNYFVDKYWIVEGVLPDGQLQLRTRTGKTHVISASDRHLAVLAGGSDGSTAAASRGLKRQSLVPAIELKRVAALRIYSRTILVRRSGARFRHRMPYLPDQDGPAI